MSKNANPNTEKIQRLLLSFDGLCWKECTGDINNSCLYIYLSTEEKPSLIFSLRGCSPTALDPASKKNIPAPQKHFGNYLIRILFSTGNSAFFALSSPEHYNSWIKAIVENSIYGTKTDNDMNSSITFGDSASAQVEVGGGEEDCMYEDIQPERWSLPGCETDSRCSRDDTYLKPSNPLAADYPVPPSPMSPPYKFLPIFRDTTLRRYTGTDGACQLGSAETGLPACLVKLPKSPLELAEVLNNVTRTLGVRGSDYRFECETAVAAGETIFVLRVPSSGSNSNVELQNTPEYAVEYDDCQMLGNYVEEDDQIYGNVDIDMSSKNSFLQPSRESKGSASSTIGTQTLTANVREPSTVNVNTQTTSLITTVDLDMANTAYKLLPSASQHVTPQHVTSNHVTSDHVTSDHVTYSTPSHNHDDVFAKDAETGSLLSNSRDTETPPRHSRVDFAPMPAPRKSRSKLDVGNFRTVRAVPTPPHGELVNLCRGGSVSAVDQASNLSDSSSTASSCDMCLDSHGGLVKGQSKRSSAVFKERLNFFEFLSNYS